MQPIEYFKANIDDIDLLCQMRIAFLNEYFGKKSESEEKILRENLERYFSKSIVDNTALCWYAKSGNEIAGIGYIEIHNQPGNFKNPSGKLGHIMNMYTLTPFRKNGICTTILNRLVASAHELGVTAFELHASEAGRPVYEKNGFVLHTDPTLRRYL